MACDDGERTGKADGVQNTILRYGRVQLCATLAPAQPACVNSVHRFQHLRFPSVPDFVCFVYFVVAPSGRVVAWLETTRERSPRTARLLVGR